VGFGGGWESSAIRRLLKVEGRSQKDFNRKAHHQDYPKLRKKKQRSESLNSGSRQEVLRCKDWMWQKVQWGKDARAEGLDGRNGGFTIKPTGTVTNAERAKGSKKNGQTIVITQQKNK